LEGTRDLSQFDNVINTPHTAWYSQYSFNELRRKSAEELARYLQGKPLKHLLT
jgi:D-3-phosphoglycerate dehydrogenase